MGTITRGKILEVSAARLAYRAAGTGHAAGDAAWYFKHFGVAFRRTDEQSARRRKSAVYMAGELLNNGRGEIFGDCVMQSPLIGTPAILVETPFSLKGGDSRDISVDVPFLRAAVEAGCPLWVALIDGVAEAVEYVDGERVDISPATDLMMRRINITPLLRDCIVDWTKAGDSKATPAFIRENKVGAYTYPRVRVNWSRVPSHYWLDAGYIPFDPAAPIPSPF